MYFMCLSMFVNICGDKSMNTLIRTGNKLELKFVDTHEHPILTLVHHLKCTTMISIMKYLAALYICYHRI